MCGKTFNAQTNPQNHMSSHNWKYDYKTTPWEQLMDKTGGNLENIKIGHYRKATKHMPKKKREKALDLIKTIVEDIPDRYNCKSTPAPNFDKFREIYPRF